MTFEKMLYTAKVRTTGSWKDIFMKHPLLRLVFVTLLAAQGYARSWLYLSMDSDSGWARFSLEHLS